MRAAILSVTRVWYAIVGAVLGVAVLRVTYHLARDREWIDAAITGALAVALLLLSIRAAVRLARRAR